MVQCNTQQKTHTHKLAFSLTTGQAHARLRRSAARLEGSAGSRWPAGAGSAAGSAAPTCGLRQFSHEPQRWLLQAGGKGREVCLSSKESPSGVHIRHQRCTALQRHGAEQATHASNALCPHSCKPPAPGRLPHLGILGKRLVRVRLGAVGCGSGCLAA